jgi:hypothetical protein
MPTLHKTYTLEVTIAQFLKACSDTELIELELLLPGYLRDVKRESDNEQFKIDPI